MKRNEIIEFFRDLAGKTEGVKFIEKSQRYNNNASFRNDKKGVSITINNPDQELFIFTELFHVSIPFGNIESLETSCGFVAIYHVNGKGYASVKYI